MIHGLVYFSAFPVDSPTSRPEVAADYSHSSLNLALRKYSALPEKTLGDITDIRRVFIGFQEHLYAQQRTAV